MVVSPRIVPMMEDSSAVMPLRWRANGLDILDQRLLPTRTHYIHAENLQAVIAAIRDMAVRGAPAIAIAAAFGMAIVARDEPQNWAKAKKELLASRPTAVHLQWMLDDLPEQAMPAEQALDYAQQLQAEDGELCRRMAEHGAALMPDNCRILTHCNTGALATGGWGTALGVIRSAHAAGKLQQVWVDETRPWLQGARLTAWELAQENIPFRLIADSAAASVMARGEVDWVVVGADRIAANGDTANKIGTYSLAVLARHHGVRFMVVAPRATIDFDLPSGSGIPIEEREAGELTHSGGQQITPDQCATYNPVFDVTPADLIDAIVTEQGVILNPDPGKMLRI